MKTQRKTIGLVVFDGIAALDLAGPADAFSCARSDGLPAYEVTAIGVSARPVVAESGVVASERSTEGRASQKSAYGKWSRLLPDDGQPGSDRNAFVSFLCRLYGQVTLFYDFQARILDYMRGSSGVDLVEWLG